ncbi:hypothetical protein FQZ97_795710 [compost metagenome]
MAAMAGRHALDRLAGAEKAAEHIGGEYPLQARAVHLFQAHLRFQHASVVDQHIEAAVVLVQGSEQL